ncbi:MAG: metalloregulator ArsR/SmtB family transcription factor, partial [Thermoleophilia bacterium]
MLEALSDGERRSTDLARITGLSQPNASAHLACLRECGLVSADRRGREKPSACIWISPTISVASVERNVYCTSATMTLPPGSVRPPGTDTDAPCARGVPPPSA